MLVLARSVEQEDLSNDILKAEDSRRGEWSLVDILACEHLGKNPLLWAACRPRSPRSEVAGAIVVQFKGAERARGRSMIFASACVRTKWAANAAAS